MFSKILRSGEKQTTEYYTLRVTKDEDSKQFKTIHVLILYPKLGQTCLMDIIEAIDEKLLWLMN